MVAFGVSRLHVSGASPPNFVSNHPANTLIGGSTPKLCVESPRYNYYILLIQYYGLWEVSYAPTPI